MHGAKQGWEPLLLASSKGDPVDHKLSYLCMLYVFTELLVVLVVFTK